MEKSFPHTECIALALSLSHTSCMKHLCSQMGCFEQNVLFFLIYLFYFFFRCYNWSVNQLNHYLKEHYIQKWKFCPQFWTHVHDVLNAYAVIFMLFLCSFWSFTDMVTMKLHEDFIEILLLSPSGKIPAYEFGTIWGWV